jgi:hypothetical protein
LLNDPKGWLPLTLKILSDRAADTLLDHQV